MGVGSNPGYEEQAVTKKNAVFWDATLCGSCENRRFDERSSTIIRMRRIDENRNVGSYKSHKN
jgi:hypothetical protein